MKNGFLNLFIDEKKGKFKKLLDYKELLIDLEKIINNLCSMIGD